MPVDMIVFLLLRGGGIVRNSRSQYSRSGIDGAVYRGRDARLRPSGQNQRLPSLHLLSAGGMSAKSDGLTGR